MPDSEQLLWTGTTTPTSGGIERLCSAFAGGTVEAPQAPELTIALIEICSHITSQDAGTTLLTAELRRRDADWTLVVTHDGRPLLHDVGRLPIVPKGRSHLYVPRRDLRSVNRCLLRAGATGLPRALVIDDDPVQRLTISLFLRGVYSAIACATTAEAELEARLQTPDVILSDIHMPNDDGMAFRRRLTRDAVLAAVPFLFVTSDRNASTRLAKADATSEAVFYKPLDKQRLLAALDGIVKTRLPLQTASADSRDAAA
jgi:two-component system chemotaxis response regulator CheY